MKKMKKFAAKGILVVILLLAVFSVGTVVAGQFVQQEDHISRMELLREYSIESESDEDELPYSGTFTYEISSGCTDDSNANDCQSEQGDVFRSLPPVTIDYDFGPPDGNFAVNLGQPKEGSVDLGTTNGDGQFTAPANVQVTVDHGHYTPVSSIDLYPNNDQPKEGEVLFSPETINYGQGLAGRPCVVPKGTYQVYATLDQGGNCSITTEPVTIYINMNDAEDTGLWLRFKSWAQDSFADQPPDEVWSDGEWMPCRESNGPLEPVQCILTEDGKSSYYYHPNLKTKFKCLIHDLF